MKALFIIATLTTLPLSLSQAWAEELQLSDMSNKPAATSMDKDKHSGMTQEKMLLMHEQMHKIIDAKNPQEREQLMQAHAKMMRDMKGSHENMGGDTKGSKTDGSSTINH